MRKHIDNKHADALDAAKRAALEPKYAAYHAAAVQRAEIMPKRRPMPRRPAREGKGEGKGKGKGEGKGKGKGWGKGGKGYSDEALRGPPPPAPDGVQSDGRAIRSYKDLDNPDDDDLFA